MSKEERSLFGWLGKPPPEIVNGPISVTRKWCALSERAGQVAKISLKPSRKAEWEAKAREIEHEYRELVNEAAEYIRAHQKA